MVKSANETPPRPAASAWLCALYAPRDLALHPNFYSEEHFTGAALLATLTQYESAILDRALRDKRAGDVSQESLTAIRVLSSLAPFDSQSDPAPALALMHGLDKDQQVAVALLASVCFSAAEDHSAAINLLKGLREDFSPGTASGDDRLRLVTLGLQEAFRRYERGLESDYDELGPLMTSLDTTVDTLSSRDCRSFRLTNGVSHQSGATITRVIDDLRASLAALRQSLLPPFADGWQNIVRSKAPNLDLVNRGHMADGFRALVTQRWETGPYSSKRTTFSVDPILTPLRRAWLHEELACTPGGVRQARKDLALALLVSPYNHLSGEEARDDAVTWLRRSRDGSTLRTAISKARAEGPLAGLARDGARVASLSCEHGSFNEQAFDVLTGAASLLTKEDLTQAQRSLKEALEAVTSPNFYLPGARYAAATHFEAACWRTQLRLSYTAGTTDHVLKELLERLSSGAEPTEDAGFTQTVAATVADMNWDLVSGSIATEWTDWLTDCLDKQAPYDHFAHQAINSSDDLLRLLSPQVVLAEARRRGGAACLELLDRFGNRTVGELTAPEVSGIQALLSQSLAAEVAEARTGSYTFGGQQSAATAASAVFKHGWHDLLEIVLSYVCNASVPLVKKAGALWIIGENVGLVNRQAQERLLEVCLDFAEVPEPDHLFYPLADPPHPAWVRLAMQLRKHLAVDAEAEGRLISSLFDMVSHDSATTRADAVSIMGECLKASDSWQVPVLLDLAHDDVGMVRARAGYFLSRSSPSDVWFQQIARTVAKLLREDAILAPLAALRGIQQGAWPDLTPEIRDVLHEVGNHASSLLREKAAIMLT